MKTDTRKQFTLIELLVVIAIIGILTGLVFPALGVVRNNARKSKAHTECLGLKAAIILYESEFGRWPVSDEEIKSSKNDALVKDYPGLCDALTGGNSKNMVFYEVGMGFKKSDGILDPWDRPYQVILDYTYDNKIAENVSAIKAVNDSSKRSGDLPSKVAVYSFGVRSDESDANDLPTLAKRKKMVTSW